jgi:hypothetical protein
MIFSPQRTQPSDPLLALLFKQIRARLILLKLSIVPLIYNTNPPHAIHLKGDIWIGRLIEGLFNQVEDEYLAACV